MEYPKISLKEILAYIISFSIVMALVYYASKDSVLEPPECVKEIQPEQAPQQKMKIVTMDYLRGDSSLVNIKLK